VDDSPPPALTVVDAPAGDSPDGGRADGASVDGSPGDAAPDTTAFMRELSSLNDDPDKAEPVVTRLVVPLTEHRRRRRLWSR